MIIIYVSYDEEPIEESTEELDEESDEESTEDLDEEELDSYYEYIIDVDRLESLDLTSIIEPIDNIEWPEHYLNQI